MKFGDYLKNLRIERRLTLRQCADQLNVDPSNWSKLERGINPAPKDSETLKQWANFFDIESDKMEQFTDFASLSRREIPLDVASDERVIAALPVFFRAIRGQELEGERLKSFMEDLRELHNPSQE